MNFEEAKQIAEIATNHDWFDYLSLVCSVTVPAIVALLSYVFFKRHSSQVLNEKLIEKEVGALYDVMECFFDFSDAFGLYHSLSYKKFQDDLTLQSFGNELPEQLKTASDKVTAEHRSMKRAIFLLEAQGEGDAAQALRDYYQAAVEFRKRLFFAEETRVVDDAVRLKGEAVSNYNEDVRSISKLRSAAVAKLSSCKTNLSHKYNN